MVLRFKLEGVIDINAEFSYVARVPFMGWLSFDYMYGNLMEQWATDAGIEMQRLTDNPGLRVRPGYAFRNEEDRMMFVLAWSEGNVC